MAQRMPRIARSSITRRSRPERQGRQPLKPGSSGTVRVILRAATRSSNELLEVRATCISVTATLRLLLAWKLPWVSPRGGTRLGVRARATCPKRADCLRRPRCIHIARSGDGSHRRAVLADSAARGPLATLIRSIDSTRERVMTTTVRKGQWTGTLERVEFSRRFRNAFVDPAFRSEDAAIDKLEAIAWDAYADGRKAPITRKAGRGFADPDYELSVEWFETRERLQQAQKVWADPKTKTRALVICGSPRNDGTCPGEISKTFRLAGLRERGAGRGEDRGRFPRPQPARLRLRPRTSIPARAACRPRCRSAIGPAAATRTIRSTRSTTGWPRSTSAGSRRTR